MVLQVSASVILLCRFLSCLRAVLKGFLLRRGNFESLTAAADLIGLKKEARFLAAAVHR